MRLVKDRGLDGEAGLRAELASRFAAELSSGELVAWICLRGGTVVATSGLSSPLEAEARAELGLGPGEALVFNMYTVPAFRRRGIAAELLGRAIAEARARGLRALRLQGTDMARSVYERAGFVDEGREMVLELKRGLASEGARPAG
jgi:GNAT superfamily N-acetyltransferase